MNANEVFEKITKSNPNIPYLSHSVIAHSAHCANQLGKIISFAIDKGVHVSYYGPKQKWRN